MCRAFITLIFKDCLRGWIGSPSVQAPMKEGAAANEIKAATGDPRFEPVETNNKLQNCEWKLPF